MSAAAGDIARLLPTLKPTAVRLTRNAEDAEDLLQDTALRALRSGQQFEQRSDVRTWLFAILKNTFCTFCRREKTRKRWTMSAEDLPYSPDAAAGGCHEDTLDSQWLLARIPSLPPKLRVVIELCVLDGLEYQQAAAELGVPVGTIRSRLFRARKALEAVP